MSEEKDQDVSKDDGAVGSNLSDKVLLGQVQERLEWKHEKDRFLMEIRELHKRMEDEVHEFKRKQIGMSTLVTVLMDARFGSGGSVYIGREEFVRLASEASAVGKDNEMLRQRLDMVDDELRIVRAHNITHRMALQESTGLKLAEVIMQRDGLKRELLEMGSNSPEMNERVNELMDMPVVARETAEEEHKVGPNLTDRR